MNAKKTKHKKLTNQCINTVLCFLQALESEIVAHEPLIDAVASAAQRMIKSKHFASHDIEKRLDELHTDLQKLKEVSSARRVKLQDALESQKVGNCNIFFFS